MQGGATTAKQAADLTRLQDRIAQSALSAADKASLVRFVLQRIYDVSNEMTLDFLKEKSPADAAKLIEAFRASRKPPSRARRCWCWDMRLFPRRRAW